MQSNMFHKSKTVPEITDVAQARQAVEKLNTAFRDKNLEAFKTAVNNLAKVRLGNVNIEVREGSTLLNETIRNGTYDMLHYLFSQRYDINASIEHVTKETKNTPLHIATMYATPEMLDLLLIRSTGIVEPFSKNQNKRTILHIATQSRGPEIVKLLLSYNPKDQITQQDVNGYTPLKYAVVRGNKATIQEVLTNARSTAQLSYSEWYALQHLSKYNKQGLSPKDRRALFSPPEETILVKIFLIVCRNPVSIGLIACAGVFAFYHVPAACTFIGIATGLIIKGGGTILLNILRPPKPANVMTQCGNPERSEVMGEQPGTEPHCYLRYDHNFLINTQHRSQG